MDHTTEIYRHCIGAFLIPYILVAVLVGMPLFFLELSVGQFMQMGPIKSFNMVPIMRGVGIASVILALYFVLYYVFVIGWGIFYFFHSFTLQPLPWTTCDNWWNTKNCKVFYNSSEHLSNFTFNSTSNSSNRTDNAVLSVEEFWNNYVIQKSNGINDIGSTNNWRLMLCFLCAWMLCYFCVFKGAKLTGKIVYFTALFPYVILITFAIRGCTLEGSGEGLKYFLYPNFTKLADTSVWTAAGSQVLYSYAIAFGCLITFGSYNDFHSNCFRYSIGLTSICSLTSILAGLSVFSVLGHMAFVGRKNVSDVVASGPGLVFKTYPTAISLMPFSQFWSVLFFLMIILVGIDSQFAGIESVICAVGDFFPQYLFRKGRREWTVLFLCAVPAVIGFPMNFGCGIFIFELFNTYSVGGYSMFPIVILEAVTFSYIYGINKFYDDIKSMIGYYPTSYLKWCYLIFTPIIGIGLLSFAIVRHKPLTIGTYTYPPWAYAFGWVLTLSSVLVIPITFVYTLVKSEGSFIQRWKSSTSPQYSQHLLDLKLETENEKFIM